MYDSTSDTSGMVIETNRRRLVGSLVGGALAGVIGWQATEADRKRGNSHHAKNRKRRRDHGETRRDGGKSHGESESKREDRASTLSDAESKQGGSPALKVLTRNLYLGADL